MTTSSYGQWAKKADVFGFSLGRAAAQHFSLNGKIYVGGGVVQKNVANNELVEYDPTNDMWISKGNLPGASNRSEGINFVINGKGYIGLGCENWLTISAPYNYLKDLWEYDVATDKWTQKANFPGDPRVEAISFVINNKAYVIGGYYSSTSTDRLKDVWEYDPVTDKWTKKNDFPNVNSILGGVGVSYNGKGYIVCGMLFSSSSAVVSKDVFEYDPNSDKWVKKSGFVASHEGFYAPVGFQIDDKVYVGLGATKHDKGNLVKNIYVYDITQDKWEPSSISDFPGSERVDAFAEVINGVAYVGGGRKGTDDYYKDMFAYTPQVSVFNYYRDTEVSIYPNPASNNIDIKLGDQKLEAQYILYDITGKIITKGTFIGTTKVDISQYQSGNYIIELKQNDQSIKQIISKYRE